MTFFGMALLTAVGTVVLAVFAIVTAWYARKAFRKQSQEVAAIERQVADEQELTRQQGELIKVQAEQVTVLRAQLEDQLKASARQAEFLELQAAELRESLKERERVADDKKRSQAAAVIGWLRKGRDAQNIYAAWVALVRNASNLPIFDVRVFFYQINYREGSHWVPVSVGGPPPDETIPMLPPGTDLSVQIPAGVMAMFGNIEVSDTSCLVSLEFTDASGNCWERDPRGLLNPA